MLESVTAESIFAEIMMDETSPKAFFLVEGPDENAVFFGHVSADVVLIVCGGKKNVLGAVGLAESSGNNSVYGLVDSDFDRIRGLDRFYPAHVVGTSTYDLISDLVMSSSDVLRRSLSAHAAPGVRVIEDALGSPIDHAVFALTSRVAGARLATIREGYPFVFKSYNFTPVVGATFEPADMAAFLQHAVCRDPHFAVDATVLQAVNAAYSEVSVNRHSSGGHDIVSASVALLRKAGSQVSIKTISGTLISVASCKVVASLSCLADLTTIARADSGVELLDCFAA
ncbi:DUF4435 domain-containing protein [Kocuria flava]|uniref:DUF4435 domain-containing protein n=1 Tax=Kocuria flava TaxID=446860 RepID=UPI00117DD080|nr:DUF4435 domain-containing protein [Kocuria flava]